MDVRLADEALVQAQPGEERLVAVQFHDARAVLPESLQGSLRPTPAASVQGRQRIEAEFLGPLHVEA